MCALVVFEVACSGKAFSTGVFGAGVGLLSVVCTHVHLQSLQHIEALPTPLRTTPERAVIPVCFEVVLKVCGPGKGAVAVLIGTAEHLLCVSTVTASHLLLPCSLRLVAMEMLTVAVGAGVLGILGQLCARGGD